MLLKLYMDGNEIIYNNVDNFVYKYAIQNGSEQQLDYKIDFDYDKNATVPVELLLLRDEKLFYNTFYMNWTIPLRIMHYYDFKEKKVVDIVKFLGLYEAYRIEFN